MNIKLEQLKAMHGMRVHLNDKVFKYCEKKIISYDHTGQHNDPSNKKTSKFQSFSRYSLPLLTSLDDALFVQLFESVSAFHDPTSSHWATPQLRRIGLEAS